MKLDLRMPRRHERNHMSINMNQMTAQALRAVGDLELQATLGRIGTHVAELSKELVSALAQLRSLR